LIRLDLPKAASPVLDELDPVRLRSVQEVMLDPSLVLRAVRSDTGGVVDFVCEDANEAAADMLEVALDDLIGSLLSITLPGPTGAFLLEECIEAVGTGVSIRFDDYVVDDVTRGGTRHFDIRGLPVDDRVVFTWRDVSDGFRNEQALAESRNRYRLLAENASDVVVLLATDGTMEWVSPSVGSQLGWDPDDLVGRPLADIVHAEDRVRLGSMRRHPTAGRASTEEMRMRCAGGAQLWVSATLRDAFDSEGRVVSGVLALRNIDRKVQTRQELENSEARFRTLAENVSDVVFATTAGRFTWVSPSVEWVLGWPPEQLVGRAVMDLVCEEDHDRARAATAGATAGERLEPLEIRFLTSSGDVRWMEAHSRSVRGTPAVSYVTGLQDIDERHARRVMLDALAAVDAVLVGAVDEDTLLADVCRTLVETSGLSLVWCCRWRDDVPLVVAAAGRGAEALVAGTDCRSALGDVASAPLAARVSGRVELEPGSGPTDGDPDPFGSWRTNLGVPVRVDGTVDLAFGMHLAATYGPDPEGAVNFDRLARQVGMAVSRVRARRQLMDSLTETALLTTAIEQAGESVVVTGVDGVIVYANPATAVTTGIPLGELVGAPSRLFASELHGPTFWREVEDTLASGASWRGIIVSRDRMGELYEGDTAITPVRDGDGTVTAYVSVLRNISHERQLAADLDRLRNDRESVVEAMSGVRVGITIEATAASFCDAVTRVQDIDLARLLLVESDEEVVPLGITGRAYLDWEVGVPLNFPRLRGMLGMCRSGSWWMSLAEAADTLPDAGSMIMTLLDEGFRSVGFAPVWWEARMVAVLVTVSRTPDSPGWIEGRRAVLDELSSFAGSVLGGQADRRDSWKRLHDDIRGIIDGSRYHPVFQPVVGLADGDVRGHEALTRFDYARRPDLVFQDAHSVGLGIELETACARDAVRAARALPSGTWLGINFSPAAVVSGALADVAAGADRPVVVEITEHVEVESYAAVRDAVSRCPGVRISVDDAGAGYASLRHILELQPDFVKLDIGLVRGIDADPARQALAAGLRHYADETGNTLIAEGVESADEARTLQKLGIPLAQGFLFGRPVPGPETALG
jgi:PAS domain S-box-containing protein